MNEIDMSENELFNEIENKIKVEISIENHLIYRERKRWNF